MSLRRMASIAAALALAASPALAGSFDDDAANAAWVARADGFSRALQGQVNIGDIKSDLGDACHGVTGDLVKYGQHLPMWAQTSFSEFCSGVNVMDRDGLNRISCKSFKRALGDIKADPAKDPAEVVRAATEWQAALAGAIQASKDNHRC